MKTRRGGGLKARKIAPYLHQRGKGVKICYYLKRKLKIVVQVPKKKLHQRGEVCEQ